MWGILSVLLLRLKSLLGWVELAKEVVRGGFGAR